MNIAIIGAGHAGRALAQGAVHAGYSVRIAARHPEHAEAVAWDTGAKSARSNAEAVEGADMVILAVPAAMLAEVADEIGERLDGKTVIDATNPVNADLESLSTRRSTAEALQRMLPNANIVKAFNTVFAVHHTNPVVEGQPLDGLYAGDSETAKAQVEKLLEDLGFRPIDVGPLSMAHALEDMELLNMRLNSRNGWQWQTEWRLVGPRS